MLGSAELDDSTLVLYLLFNIFRQQQAYSKENLCLTTRSSAHLLLPNHNSSSRNVDECTRNEVTFKNN